MTAFLLGLTVGVVVGIVWDDAWELYCNASRLAAQEELGVTDHTNGENGEGVVHHSMIERESGGVWLSRSAAFAVVVILALLQIGTGILGFVGSQRAANNRDEIRAFAQCQSDYNQQFREAYDAVSGASRGTQDALYQAIVVLPASFSRPLSAAEQRQFQQNIKDYVAQYRRYRAERDTNKYPKPPDEFCGPPPTATGG